ncbi:hypothetical protein BJV74DRAFT_144087 [Russula compacta]|nr:hypothetical protein BJV74DRAFT_144087 [Russula compacta]
MRLKMRVTDQEKFSEALRDKCGLFLSRNSRRMIKRSQRVGMTIPMVFSTLPAYSLRPSHHSSSRDSGDQTVALLSQMSQQLVGISKGTALPPPSPLATSPPNLPSAIRINILWLLSMAISITCALLATLI